MSKINTISDFAKLFLPELVVEHFDLVKHETNSDSQYFYYSEKNIPSLEVNSKIHSKGYYKEAIVQDFPIRGKSVYLYIKRRKWIEIESGRIIKRDWDLVTKGTRMTNDFADFLKEVY